MKYNTPTEKREIDWNPQEHIEKILKDSVLFTYGGEELVRIYLNRYEEFRNPQPSEIVDLPEIPVIYSDLYQDLFSTKGGKKQRGLDNIAKDFLCFILLTQFLRENDKHREDSFIRFLTDKQGRDNPNTNLNNTILRVEVLFNFLRSQGYVLNMNPEDDTFILFTSTSQRRINEKDIKPIEWITGTARFSKLIRRQSVLFQERKKLDEILPQIAPEDWGLPLFVRYLNGERDGETMTESLRFSLNREFRLWGRFRQVGFPSLRDISIATEIPYLLLLGIRDKESPSEYYTGMNLLNRLHLRTIGILIQNLKKD